MPKSKNEKTEDILNSINLLQNARSGDVENDEDSALKFMLGARGRYIITKGLMYGMKYMEGEIEVLKEYSDIADMKFLLENLRLTKDFYFIIENEVDQNRLRRKNV